MMFWGAIVQKSSICRVLNTHPNGSAFKKVAILSAHSSTAMASRLVDGDLGALSHDLLKKKFDIAVDITQKIPKNGPIQPTNDQRFRFYGLYKQASNGPCNTQKPGFFDLVGRWKWDAWLAQGDKDRIVAMIEYITEINNLLRSADWEQLDHTARSQLEQYVSDMSAVDGKSNGGSVSTTPVNTNTNSQQILNSIASPRAGSSPGGSSMQQTPSTKNNKSETITSTPAVSTAAQSVTPNVQSNASSHMTPSSSRAVQALRQLQTANQASLSALEQRLDVYLQSKNSENDVLERLTARLSVLETQLQLALSERALLSQQMHSMSSQLRSLSRSSWLTWSPLVLLMVYIMYRQRTSIVSAVRALIDSK